MTILFLDFEASSLNHGSFPIEVGWCDESGIGEAHLILPAPGWKDWSVASQSIHGIRREHLHAQGRPHDEVAQRVLEVLGAPGVRVVSDAPSFDGRWLGSLLHAAGHSRTAIRVGDVEEVYAEACRSLLAHLPPADAPGFQLAREALLAEVAGMIEGATAAEAARRRTRHRALEDAQGMAWILADVRKRAGHVT